MAKPAKHPEVLLAHMVKFAAALQSPFCRGDWLGFHQSVLCTYLVGMSDRELEQLAQMMIFEFLPAGGRQRGQAIFTDLNLYWEIPKHFENVPAIGPGGEFTEKPIVIIWTNPSVLPRPSSMSTKRETVWKAFFFPKPLVHITEKFFQTPGHMDFLHRICEVASEKGNTYFVFDRGETAKISECCASVLNWIKQTRRRQTTLEDAVLCAPERDTQSSKNCLPGSREDARLFSKIAEFVEMAVKAHLEKNTSLKNFSL